MFKQGSRSRASFHGWVDRWVAGCFDRRVTGRATSPTRCRPNSCVKCSSMSNVCALALVVTA
eukprot:811913-Prymnesium_polylepis.1